MSTEKALIGPDSIPSEAATYGDIVRQQERLLELALGLRQPGPGELKAGEVPRLAGGPWASGDHFGIERPTGTSPDGADPSGVDRNRGV